MSAPRGWIVALALAACADDASQGAGGRDTGGHGAGGATEAGCSLDYTKWAVPGVRVDKERNCTEVSAEQIRFIDVCRPNDETKYDSASFFYCLREVATGEEYWINPVSWLVEPVLDAWEFCQWPIDRGMSSRLVPRPCFAECPDTDIGYEEPSSTCAEEATRIVFACGGDSAWDENCCRRKPCSGSPCPDGFECREPTVWTPSSFCWVGIAPDADPETVDLNDPYAACSCVGAFNPPEPRCFPL